MEYPLGKWHDSFCSNAGLFGVLLSVTCLVQQLLLMTSEWMLFTAVSVIYILCITAFVFLIKKHPAAPLLLLIGVILVFLLEVFMIYSLAFSLVLMLLLLYLCAVCSIIYVEGVPAQLKRRYIAIKSEADEWKDIL